MNPAPISRRALVAGVAATTALAIPAGIVEALAAETPPAEAAGALPVVFDPAAFCRNLTAAGYDVHVVRSARLHDRGRASIAILPRPGRGFDGNYREVMARWADRLDATPDHVEQVARYAFDQFGAIA